MSITSLECNNITGITAKKVKNDAVKLTITLLIVKQYQDVSIKKTKWNIFCKDKVISTGETPEKAIEALGYETNVRYITKRKKLGQFTRKKSIMKKRRK